MEKSKKVIVCSLFLTFGGISTAVAEEVVQRENENKGELKSSPHHWSLTTGLYSDYLFRGLSFAKHGQFYGSIDYSHDSGLYAGFGYGTVHKDAVYGNTYETDYYVGWRKEITPDFALTGEIFNFTYPQGYTFNGQNSDVVELILKADYKGLNVKYYRALTDWFGYNTASLGTTEYRGKLVGHGDSKGTNYIDINYTDKIPNTDTNYHLHIGRQVVENYSVADYVDMSVGISRSFEFAGSKGWNTGLSYIHSNTKKGWYVDASGDDLDKSRFFFYVRHTF
ncbi:MAG: TorF family putative porin [Methylophilus sp.]|uniref:TorF family putative porin n=1 Tax=Methylophilus sp. TaxID=29541 RepID=UPI003FA01F58